MLVCRCRRCTGGWPRDRMTADSQADTHKEEASLSSLPSFLPLLSLLQAHHVGLAPPYKIPRGSGSARGGVAFFHGILNLIPVHWSMGHFPRNSKQVMSHLSMVHCPLPAFEQIHPDSIEDFSQMAMGICNAGPRVAQRTTAPLRRRRSDPIPHFNALPL